MRFPERIEEAQPELGRLRNAFSESNLPIIVDVLDWALIPELFREEILGGYHVVRRAGRE